MFINVGQYRSVPRAYGAWLRTSGFVPFRKGVMTETAAFTCSRLTFVCTTSLWKQPPGPFLQLVIDFQPFASVASSIFRDGRLTKVAACETNISSRPFFLID
ncbi:unnamed protein product [Durusdinium trenchii]|uniref:Uncharacterized protein n=1 Tax=Durusdinium trenchii TaxID=1381693 RepID=A0ABP0P6C2_9DINO